MKRAVVIGSGLGGLQVALNLQRAGYAVSVLERDKHPGGCLQAFHRGTTYFDTGFHYIGGLADGQPLNELFRYYGLMDLPWKQLDKDCFDEVILGDHHFRFAQGFEAFQQQMTEYFPNEADGIQKVVDLYRYVGEHTLDHRTEMNSLFSQSAWEWLSSTIHDPILQQVLSGTCFKMQLDRETLPLYLFAQINSTFIQSAWRLDGSGDLIVKRLTDQITANGGEVRVQARVSHIDVRDGKVCSVVVNDEEHIDCELVVSDIHPASTIALLSEGVVKNVYRHRLERLRNSYGVFTTYVRLKENSLPYLNRNLHIHARGSDAWESCRVQDGRPRVEHAMVHYYPDQAALDILTPVSSEVFAPYADTPHKHRGEECDALVEDIVNQSIELVAPHIPGLKESIADYFTSTPLTYAHYLEAPAGTAYGVMKDWRSPLTTVLSPRSPIEGLYYTGQNLNLHGVLGVTMTSRLTTETILNTTQI